MHSINIEPWWRCSVNPVASAFSTYRALLAYLPTFQFWRVKRLAHLKKILGSVIEKGTTSKRSESVANAC